MLEALITIAIVVVVVGLIVWLVNNYIPMDARFKQVFNVIVSVGLIIWLLFTLMDFVK